MESVTPACQPQAKALDAKVNSAGAKYLLSLTKTIMDRCCRLRRLPCRDADLIKTLDHIADCV